MFAKFHKFFMLSLNSEAFLHAFITLWFQQKKLYFFNIAKSVILILTKIQAKEKPF